MGIVNNLVTVNGTHKNLILECGTIYEKNQTIVKFKKSFPNKCLGVFFTDVAGDKSSMNQQSVEEVSNLSFKYVTTFGGYDTAYYLAIGY